MSDVYGDDKLAFRVLMRFGGLDMVVPPGAAVKQALLNLTFINWQPATATLQARGRSTWPRSACLMLA